MPWKDLGVCSFLEALGFSEVWASGLDGPSEKIKNSPVAVGYQQAICELTHLDYN